MYNSLSGCSSWCESAIEMVVHWMGYLTCNILLWWSPPSTSGDCGVTVHAVLLSGGGLVSLFNDVGIL